MKVKFSFSSLHFGWKILIGFCIWLLFLYGYLRQIGCTKGEIETRTWVQEEEF